MTSNIALSIDGASFYALEKLEQFVEEMGNLQSKLILLVGNGSKGIPCMALMRSEEQ